MTNEELVKLYQQGNKQALQELLQQNKNFIYKVAKKFFIGRDNAVDKEDLLQEGYIGIIKATEKYKEDSGVSFISYAYYWIYQCIHKFLYPTNDKRNNKNVYVESLNTNIIGIDGDIEQAENLADEDIYPEVIESISDKQDYMMIENIIKTNRNINKRALEIIRLRYGVYNEKCYTFEDIGNKLGISYQYVRQIQENTFREIRKSRWARMRRLELNVTRTLKPYDSGKITNSLFYKIDRETSNNINCVI